MRTRSLAVAGLLTLATVAANAQATRRSVSASAAGSAFDVTTYAGYMVFGDYLSGPLGTSLTNAPAPMYGVQLGMRMTPSLSFIANAAMSNSDIRVGVPFIGGVSVANSSMTFYDVGLQYEMPVTSTSGVSFVPFVQAGVGGMHYEITQSLLSTSATNLAANVAVGADVGIAKGIDLRVMAKDYIGKFDFQDATNFDVNTNTTQSYALSAGIRITLW